MPTSSGIMAMLETLEIRKAPYRSDDGGNFINDHTPMDPYNAARKIELFVSFGGKLTRHPDHIHVAWEGHSTGELEVFRVAEDRYFVHGEIIAG